MSDGGTRAGRVNSLCIKKRLAEYEAQYEHPFTLEPCWNILKDHAAWKCVEMLKDHAAWKRVAKNPTLPKPPQIVAAAMKHMASNIAKLDMFEGVDFQRWQKKMHFLLSSISVVYVLTTPIPEDDGDDLTVEQVRKRNKWDNDDYVCKELWNSLEAKYMAEDASSKKFLVSNSTNYKMTDSRPVLEQYNELLGILGRFTQHKINMDESIQVSCIIDKLPLSWKDFKHTLKRLKEELTLVELSSHLRIKESLRV
ncbi:hypothetical protein Tco_0782936 [Tanacetum coccineum]